jgi:hypothetical protein
LYEDDEDQKWKIKNEESLVVHLSFYYVKGGGIGIIRVTIYNGILLIPGVVFKKPTTNLVFLSSRYCVL